MKISGWGKRPVIEASLISPVDTGGAADVVLHGTRLIARGLGRSYGDSSLAENMLSSRWMDYFIHFDDTSGELTCMAGVSLQTIIKTFLPAGWFLPVTPGTMYVSVGGAIAADVHGKNHHKQGSFGDYIREITLVLGNGDELSCSRQSHADLFHATCGGMGLTGFIVSARLQLVRVRGDVIEQQSIKTADLSETINIMQERSDVTYSVSWMDGIASGKSLGRSVVFLGEHADGGISATDTEAGVGLPFDFPDWVMHRWNMRTLNAIYYHYPRGSRSTVDLRKYFYPLDRVRDWNRAYGKNGFLQYQFVVPERDGVVVFSEIVKKIAASGSGSFLSVVKLLGESNDNLLSFPMKGMTLALDFKFRPQILPLLDMLDEMVADCGGRVYLAKDSRMNDSTFRKMYPQWEVFQSVREKYHALGVFESLQSKRLGL